LEQTDLLREIIQALERLDIPYMVVGSLASTFYGEPRMTQDIDVVVDLKEQKVRPLCSAFSSDDYYVSEQAAVGAVRARGQFNIIHSTSGNKVDLLIMPANAWGESEMSRRQRTLILPDLEGYCARPEDVILGKMQYFQEGGSEKHLRDIIGILKVSGDAVDREYVARWAQKMGLSDVWLSVLERLEGGRVRGQ
jgi:hypothetical protein